MRALLRPPMYTFTCCLHVGAVARNIPLATSHIFHALQSKQTVIICQSTKRQCLMRTLAVQCCVRWHVHMVWIVLLFWREAARGQ